MRVSNKWIIIAVIISFLVTITSLLGIFDPGAYQYETENWTLQARGQDIGNLIAVIVLLGSSSLLTKKSTGAYLVWVGTLMYFMYAFVIYAFFIHFNYLFLPYIAVLGLTFYTLFHSLREGEKYITIHEIKSIFFVYFAAIILILTGSLFGLLWLSEIIPALISGQIPQTLIETGLWVNPIQVIDLAIVLPAMIGTGLLLFKKNESGYFYAAPWLTFSVLMGSSIVAAMGMMSRAGYPNTIFPLIMVGILVSASLFSLYLYLRSISVE